MNRFSMYSYFNYLGHVCKIILKSMDLYKKLPEENVVLYLESK